MCRYVETRVVRMSHSQSNRRRVEEKRGQLHVTLDGKFECCFSSKNKRPKIALGIVSLFLLTLFRELLQTFYP